MSSPDLLKLILELADGKEDVAAATMKSLEVALSGYRRTFKPNLAETRKELRDLHKAAQGLVVRLKRLSPQALSLFIGAYGAPKGRTVKDLERTTGAAAQALASLSTAPARAPDISAYALAEHVAHIIHQDLGIVPTATRDEPGRRKYPRKGAAFARVLRSSLAAAGKPNVDIGPLIDSGLAAFKDPGSPYR